jgi:hypothetical protein
MDKKLWGARVSFTVTMPADNAEEVDSMLNDLLDKLGAVDTEDIYWDDCEWVISEPFDKENN